MKISTIILSSLIGSITLYFLAIFGEISLVAEKNTMERDSQLITTPPFKYVVVHDLSVHYLDTPDYGLEILTPPGKKAATPEYHLSGDTLYLFDWKESNSPSTLRIKAPIQSIKKFQVQNGFLEIKFQETPDSIGFEIDHAHFRLKSESKSELQNVMLHVKNQSQVDLFDVKSIQHLQVEITESQVRIHSPIERLYGSMSAQSVLSLKHVTSFEFQQDPNSRMIMTN